MTEELDVPTGHDHVVATHAHDFMQLIYIQAGHHSMRVEGRDWALATGDAFLVPPGTSIATHHQHTDPSTKMWVVLFSADALEPSASTLLTTWRDHPLLSAFARTGRGRQRTAIPPVDQEAWCAHLTGLRLELLRRRDGYTDAVRAYLSLLLIHLGRLELDMPMDLDREPLLAAVFRVIEARYHEPISLVDVAGAVSQSRGHLASVVQERTGRTVGQWITERRMREARRLLCDTDLTISQVAARVGYDDPGYFTRRFHSEHRTAPQAWRRAGRQLPQSP